MHIVNQGWSFDAMFQIFKPFLNDHMRSKLFMHGSDMQSLHKHISPQHLPKKYENVFC
jgi:hypothetical protein